MSAALNAGARPEKNEIMGFQSLCGTPHSGWASPGDKCAQRRRKFTGLALFCALLVTAQSEHGIVGYPAANREVMYRRFHRVAALRHGKRRAGGKLDGGQ